MRRILAWLGAVLISTGVMGEDKTVQFSLTPDIARFDRIQTIEGLSLGIWGENPQTALALGVVNGSTGRSAGASLACMLNYADSYTGVQWAPVNYTRGKFRGWQAGFVNYTAGVMKGLQTGVVNYAGHLTGLQLGLVNYAATAQIGVQVGPVNLIPRNDWFTGSPEQLAPGMVLVNWRF